MYVYSNREHCKQMIDESNELEALLKLKKGSNYLSVCLSIQGYDKYSYNGDSYNGAIENERVPKKTILYANIVIT